MIGVFDSGNGGLSVLQELLRTLPHEKYIYYADLAHCPYGEKTREYVISRAREITGELIAEGCNMIVVACNTATAAAIGVLRSEFPSVPFVGIEPAVKPAALHTESGVIGVLATAGTLKGSNYLDLRERYSSDSVHVVEQVGEGFVELVEAAFARAAKVPALEASGAASGAVGMFETELSFGPEAEGVVRRALQPLLDAGADNIVLGCTHYPFLADIIAAVAGPDVKIINPAPAVAAQAARLLPGSDNLPRPIILYRQSI